MDKHKNVYGRAVGERVANPFPEHTLHMSLMFKLTSSLQIRTLILQTHCIISDR